MEAPRTFDEFWPYYLSQHERPITRWLHVVGNLSALALLAAVIVLQRWSLLPLVLVIGYGLSWVGHFFFEKNRPATLTYPWWSLRADFKMVWILVSGRTPV